MGSVMLVLRRMSSCSAPVSRSRGGLQTRGASQRQRAERGGAAAQIGGARLEAGAFGCGLARRDGVDPGKKRAERHEIGEIGGAGLGADPRVGSPGSETGTQKAQTRGSASDGWIA